MKVHITPQRSDAKLSASCDGDRLTINGETFDFTLLPDGCELPQGAVSSSCIVGSIQRIEGVIEMTLAVPYGPGETPCEEQTKVIYTGALWP